MSGTKKDYLEEIPDPIQTESSESYGDIAYHITTFSMGRSCQRAFVRWLAHQMPHGEVLVIHNCWYVNWDIYKQDAYRYSDMRQRHINRYHDTELKQIRKDLLITSFEDIPYLNKYRDKSYIFPRYIGEVARAAQIIILRDPFNLFASRLKFGKRLKGDWEDLNFHARWFSQRHLDLWCVHAENVLGIRNDLQNIAGNKVYVLQNQWHTDINYRKHICENLNIPFTDLGKDTVWNNSSFQIERSATNLQLEDRWKQFVNVGHPLYNQLFSHERLLENAKKLFPELTEAVLRCIQ